MFENNLFPCSHVPQHEVVFVGLSKGGHQGLPSNDKLPFNANGEVLKFYAAH